jgi:hypothetical protein
MDLTKHFNHIKIHAYYLSLKYANISSFSEYSEENPNLYNNKPYHTYAYVESVSEILNIDGKEQYIKKFKEDFINDEWLDMEKHILDFLQHTFIQENLIKKDESFIEIFDPVIAYNMDFTQLIWNTVDGKQRREFFEDSKIYQLFFTNFPYEKLKTDIQFSLDKFNKQKLSFIKGNRCYILDIYSES